MLRLSLLALILAGAVATADISATGGWVKQITSADLSAGAGSDLPLFQDSSVGASIVTITLSPGAWRVKARLGASASGSMRLFVRRASAGNGAGSIAGGEAFVEVGDTEVELFTGSGDRSNISLQFRAQGLNRTVPPGNYSSSIVFTVQ